MLFQLWQLNVTIARLVLSVAELLKDDFLAMEFFPTKIGLNVALSSGSDLFSERTLLEAFQVWRLPRRRKTSG